ncbi:uncharacterized protein LOC131019482 isoform X1 [Salvia miltiorrhiza]|uniref:uncharacterized protein LOC131019482 isoform X1 n=1 Tax=Salvia miltiorrhiza TaxID=226208 RepID=UPI0025AB895D|nr:uncharacterized protein LOC131019482 isoform X1 [Salvia miltiorrhiza]XP_057804010.1 uncharacterized protein LOC131019482 isoform X1 [Salvia miltiorrhiza]
MASVDAVNPPPPLGGIRVEDLTRIDINLLSQSELQALSLCSVSARRSDDVVSPQLDRTVFNESAGSRRQTYSRLHHRSHSRLPRLHPSLKPHSYPQSSSDPVSHSIVHFLKHFLNGNHNPPPPPPPPAPAAPDSPKSPAAAEVGFLGLQENVKFKRKRGRRGRNLSKPPMLLENGVGIELQRVNGRGEMVDFAELENKGDELYGEELKRRTAGLETEEAVLGVLRDLEGQWCSRRKKRKYVDAGTFGDVLPVGWKLLLGLRRRGYRVSVYCRRYISPTGQQFLSCKEAASFLRSYFSNNDAVQQRDQKTSSIQQAYALSSEMLQQSPCPADKTDDMPHAIVAHSALAINSSSAHENEDCLMGIENLPEVQVQDIFECFKCRLTFDEKNVYLQHLFSFHQKTTKRYKLGTPVGDGVIIKDGKYECQFCHKVFQERRSYNGHVGSHVRNTGKNSGELSAPVDAPINAESVLKDGVPLRSSKMDALIEIAHNSIFGTSTNVNREETTSNHSAVVLRVEEAQAASSCHEEKSTSDPVKIQAEDFSADKTLLEDSNHGRQALTKDNGILKDDKAWSVNIETNPTCINDSPAGSCEIQKYEGSSLEVDYENRSLKPSEDHLQDAPELTVEEIMFDGGVSSVPLTESFQFFPPFDSVSNKGEHEFSVVDQKLENVTGFEELRFDDMEPFKYGFGNGQELSSLPGGSINLDSNSTIEDEFNSSVRFGQEEIMLNTLHTNQLTVCVWCRTEFKLEGIESETLSDSIGYMCPTCKAKISGHFDGGLSMDPHNF